MNRIQYTDEFREQALSKVRHSMRKDVAHLRSERDPFKLDPTTALPDSRQYTLAPELGPLFKLFATDKKLGNPSCARTTINRRTGRRPPVPKAPAWAGAAAWATN